MTPREYEKRLKELSPKELEEFNEAFGGNRTTIPERVRDYDPKHEWRICGLLGLQTEEEKRTEAVLRTANAADQSARSARCSVIVAGIACFIALAAAVVTGIGLFRGP